MRFCTGIWVSGIRRKRFNVVRRITHRNSQYFFPHIPLLSYIAMTAHESRCLNTTEHSKTLRIDIYMCPPTTDDHSIQTSRISSRQMKTSIQHVPLIPLLTFIILIFLLPQLPGPEPSFPILPQ